MSGMIVQWAPFDLIPFLMKQAFFGSELLK
jgi:hypothetical protein